MISFRSNSYTGPFDRFTLRTISPMNYCIFGQCLRANQLTSSTDDTIVRYFHIARHMTLAFKDIFLADFGGLHLTAHFENIVGADDQNGRFAILCVDGIVARVIDDGGVLFDETIFTDNNRTGFGDDGDSRMNNAAARYCDVARENAIVAFANNCLWHDLQSEVNRGNILFLRSLAI